MAYPTDLKYTKDHEWVRLTGDVAEVGITDYAQQQLGDVVYVELPDGRDASSTAGAVFGTIESVKAVSELFAPVSGRSDRGERARSRTTRRSSTRDPHETWMVTHHGWPTRRRSRALLDADAVRGSARLARCPPSRLAPQARFARRHIGPSPRGRDADAERRSARRRSTR